MRARRWLLLAALVLAAGLAGCATDETDRSSPYDDPASDDESEGGASDQSSNETGGSESPADPGSLPAVELEPVAEGFELPLLATAPPDGTDRLFVVEQPGTVRVVEDGKRSTEPYLDLTDRTEARGEQGLLGLAFHPEFAENGRLFASYTDENGGSVLERFVVDDPRSGTPDADEGTVLFTRAQPYSNHNGGHVAFGPDGHLYYALGDGGAGGDPEGNAQDAGNVLGSMLRIDPSGETASPPPGNPFVDEEGHDLIWAYGLRNPWRFSFDRATGDLYVGDVGQGDVEEVDRQPANASPPLNYGWDRFEGSQQFEGEADQDGFTFPIVEYDREGQRCAVTGGYVYRGEAIDDLAGWYVYGDYCSGEIWVAHETSDGWRTEQLLDTDERITSFGEDESGEIHVVGREGTVYRVVEG
jgi:glucose/arabinose dehydrogenase